MLRHRIRTVSSEVTRVLFRRPMAPLPKGTLLHPADSYPVRPALYDTDQLGRVTACGFGVSLDTLKVQLDETSALARPPERVTLKDGVCLGGRLYTAEAIHYMSDVRVTDLFAANWPHHEHLTLTNSRLGLKFFGHWLQDDCAAREIPSDAPYVALTRPDWGDSAAYEAAFGQDWAPTRAFTFGQLDIVTDIGFGPDKRTRYHRLRDRIRHTGAFTSKPGRIVYIARGGGADRAMSNEGDLTKRLAEAGVTIVRTEDAATSVPDAVHDARIVIGVEGSQLCHAVYGLADKGALLVLQPPDRFYCAHHEWTRLLGMPFGFVVGTQAAEGFTIDPDEVLAMIDRLDQAIDQP